METAIQIQRPGAALAPLADITQAAGIIARSGLFGVKSPEQAAALMLVAQSEGLHYAQAVQDYDIIQGRPALKSSSMLARFQRAGGSIKWLQRTDSVCEAELSHPQGGTLKVKWDLERAKKAGLGAKEMWTKYPSQMLSARAISEGIRALFPACLNGFYAVEEAQDFGASEPAACNKAASAPPLAVEAELALPSPPPEAQEPKPDLSVCIPGSAAPTPGKPMEASETARLCEWIRSLPDKSKAMGIVGNYCRPSAIGALSKAQAEKLIGELANVFGITYAPCVFGEGL